MKIDAAGLTHRELNERLREAVAGGTGEIRLDNVLGQRFIAAGLKENVRIEIFGTAGNDLGAFMDGPRIHLHGNGEDGVGNTMSGGKIVIYGDCGDILGHSVRGGKIFVRGDVGWRCGIHAKSYEKNFPVIIIGGRAGDYLGEYLAGGLIVILGLPESSKPLVGKFTGTGMHGGTVYLRGPVSGTFLGKEVTVTPAGNSDLSFIQPYLSEFTKEFRLDIKDILSVPFQKLTSHSSRPYGQLYAY